MINFFQHKLYTKTEVDKIVKEKTIIGISNILKIGSGIRWYTSESSPVPEGWLPAGTDMTDPAYSDAKYDAIRTLYGNTLPVEDNTIFLAFYKEAANA